MIPIIHLRLLLSWGSYRIRFHFIQPFIHTTKECKFESPANRNSALHLWTSVFSVRYHLIEAQFQKYIFMIFIQSRITLSIRLQSPVQKSRKNLLISPDYKIRPLNPTADPYHISLILEMQGKFTKFRMLTKYRMQAPLHNDESFRGLWLQYTIHFKLAYLCRNI